MINIKKDTVIKILRRYRKGLAVMELDAIAESQKNDAEHYKVDRLAIEQAIKIIERSNA